MNLKNYIAVVHKEKTSDFGVSFPDFPGCITAAGDLDEAKEMAVEALSGHISMMLEDGDKIPSPTSLAKFKPAKEYKNSIYCLIEVMPKVKVKPKKAARINITMEPDLLHDLDEMASDSGIPRSVLIAKAVETYIESRA
jgi:predicted RNase H-like HicB family nuclease